MTDFNEPSKLLSLLTAFDRPWGVCGGWAVDLFLGKLTRPHHDLEIAIRRDDQHQLRSVLRGWRFYKSVRRSGGGILLPWQDDETLALPVHEVHAIQPQGELTTLEILLNESENGTWRYRRNPDVTLPMADVWKRHETGIPYLTPEIVLLYKSKSPRARDTVDSRSVLPELNSTQRAWLHNAIAVSHPNSPWLADLA